MHGVLVINKPQGISSAALSQRLKKKFNLNKTGHAGTLDPLATGVLIVCVNEATKMATYFLESDKEYEGTLLLGTQTDTYDITGHRVTFDPHISISDEALKIQMEKNIGYIEHLPPMYSAVKKNGKPLYKYAREKINVDRSVRHVHIYDFQFIKREGLEVSFYLHCSKGTYVRTLCHDLGRDLGTYACLKSLRRTRSGMFRIQDAVDVLDLSEENLTSPPHWKSLSEMFKSLHALVLSQGLSERVRRGYSPRFHEVTVGAFEKGGFYTQGWVYFLDAQGDPLAVSVAHPERQAFELVRVFNP